MPITADTLRWFQSQRMTDEDDGGGRMAPVEIVPSVENQIFDDLSDVDRAAGDVSIRKVYAAVASADDDKYLDAGAVLFRPPADPDVAVTAFSTGDYYDERADMQALLESSVVRGGLYTGWLWGDHGPGQRSVTLWQRESYPLPPVGLRIDLSARSAGAETHHQILWVTRIVSDIVERTDNSGTYAVRRLTLEIAEPLRDSYTGTEPSRADPSNTATVIYETRYNPDTVPMVGIRPLVEAAEVGDYTVRVDSLYTPMIPTALAETALPDVTPGGDWATLVSGGSAIARSITNDVIKPGASLFLGGPVLPGTLSITVSGSVLTDDGGRMRLSGTDVGTVDYSNGVCIWNNACPAFGTATKTLTYQPAALPLRVANTARQWVTVENQGFVWVYTLAPIPAPGSLRVSYRVNDQWYLIADDGSGHLAGVDSSYGTGTLDYGTGTVTLSLSALPDPDSAIVFAWGVPVTYIAHGGEAVDPLNVRGQTEHPGIVPGTVTVTWGANVLTDTDGILTGTGGSGTIDYATGAWTVTPTLVPAIGTEFTIDYQYGPPVVDVFTNVDVDINGDVDLALSQVPVAGSVRVEYSVIYYPPGVGVGTVYDQVGADDGLGGLVLPNGGLGAIDYGGQSVLFDPAETRSIIVPVYGWED